ncbi:MAG: V-type ATPase 116kDa subunit family protein, partial [Oscillospiraceae bacterium]
MSIEKMELVNVVGLLKDLDSVLLKCCDSGQFHIESPDRASSTRNGFTILNEDNPYTDALKLIYSLSRPFGVHFKRTDYDDLDLKTMDEINEYVNDINAKFEGYSQGIKDLQSSISLKEEALVQLNHLRGLNVDFGRIFACKHIAVRFGKLPSESFQKLEYYDDKPICFVPYDDDGTYCWGVYFTPSSFKEFADDIFESLFFERVKIPNFVKSTPNNAMEEITINLTEEKKKMADLSDEYKKVFEEEKVKLSKVFTRLKYGHDTFELRKYAAVINDKFYITGFIPKKETKNFNAIFEDLPYVSVVINPPEIDERIEPPTKLNNNKFAKPFSMFVGMYGLPEYHGFNPTNFVAITYTLLFGIMFGDFGQGLVLALVGFLLWKFKKLELGQIITRVGFSSAFFGLIYGSVFGFEEVLTPIYKMIGLQSKPIDVFNNTTLILAGSIGIGIVIIITTIIINIIIGFKKKDYERAIFGNNGIVGLVFFGSVLVGGISTLLLGKNLFTAPFVICLIVLPLLIMMFRVPLSNIAKHKRGEKESIGDFIASNFFEVFEFLLGYATNTLSFVRIGGFVLSHAGMMSVVMLLADGAAAGVSPVVIILGNIFVMGMEGLLVGIQVLRLEFYEMFSRF